jgi:hypothetical protein
MEKRDSYLQVLDYDAKDIDIVIWLEGPGSGSTG